MGGKRGNEREGRGRERAKSGGKEREGDKEGGHLKDVLVIGQALQEEEAALRHQAFGSRSLWPLTQSPLQQNAVIDACILPGHRSGRQEGSRFLQSVLGGRRIHVHTNLCVHVNVSARAGWGGMRSSK